MHVHLLSQVACLLIYCFILKHKQNFGKILATHERQRNDPHLNQLSMWPAWPP